MKKYEVVAAIIEFGSKFLCVQRGDGKYLYVSRKFEFPGGKIEVGESEESALIREIREELHMDIHSLEKYLTVEHEYPDFELVMHSFLCKVDSAELILTEHIDAKWLPISELTSLDWAAADIPIVKKLIA